MWLTTCVMGSENEETWYGIRYSKRSCLGGGDGGSAGSTVAEAGGAQRCGREPGVHHCAAGVEQGRWLSRVRGADSRSGGDQGRTGGGFREGAGHALAADGRTGQARTRRSG